jgi:hypothetical protein
VHRRDGVNTNVMIEGEWIYDVLKRDLGINLGKEVGND